MGLSARGDPSIPTYVVLQGVLPLAHRQTRATSMTAADRLLLAEQMMKEWGEMCAVCGTKLIAYWQDFVKVGHPLCDKHMRGWQRGERAPTTRVLL